GLKSAATIKNHEQFKASAANPWFEQLARLTVGVPRELSTLSELMMSPKAGRTLYVHFHNPHTMIFADKGPITALLQADKRCKTQQESGAAAAKSAAQPVKAKGDSKKPADKESTPTENKEEAAQPTPAPSPTTRLETYVTIKPALKNILESMEG